MTKKKRNVIIIVAVVLVVAIALSLSLGLTLGRKKEVWEPAFAVNEEVTFSVLPVGREILNTSVTLDDLSPEYREKLLAFTLTNEGEWKSNNIFRKYDGQMSHWFRPDKDEMLEILRSKAWSQERGNEVIDNIYDDTGADGEIVMSSCELDWSAQSAYRIDDNYTTYTKTVNFKNVGSMSENKTVKFFGGRESLGDGEILVHKWVYYSLYASTHELSIDKAKVEEILDSKDTVAKNAILRNYRSEQYGADGMAMEYYGIIPEDLSDVLEITLTSADGARSQNYKIVGYFSSELLENSIISASVSVDEGRHSLEGDYNYRLNSQGWSLLESDVYYR